MAGEQNDWKIKMITRNVFFLTGIVAIIGITVFFFVPGLYNSKTTPDQKVLLIGVLPDETDEKLRERYELLFQHFERNTGLGIELVIPKDYSNLLELFGQNKVDVAYFGGLTFLKAQHQYSAVPLVMRDTDLRFRSYFLARAERSETTLDDFKGKRLAFGSKLSTSGHLMPRHFLMKKEIDPETYFSEILFSGAHDKTGYLVLEGDVDLGVANASIIDSMLADGRLPENEIKIIWKTPPYPDYVWAARTDLPQRLQKKLISAFLQLSTNDENHAQILKQLNAGGFLPASLDDFEELDSVARSIGML
jgi:phosphonate transport system substrate-binding protein